ncbi:hemin-degrading factor [Rhizobium sp. L1K21]|uniref:hemin-degrading factor n=1 Tax=Rhizobium sp. L1K21 TaxID=2954933 RepID=UPI00209255AF|nr:ChuX/HutX family heme-like substrate-binding protein [Rhizobium sp. L1K21]MCO6185248.1 hemin-degrading factor [Rhizobium sp. L1K21]
MTAAMVNAEHIRQFKLDNPKMREREIAKHFGISEAEYVAAWLGHGATRIATDFELIFPRLEALGEVLALTRNESAVHEKIGVYDRYIQGKHAAMMLGELIDMRMFPKHWVFGFAVEMAAGDAVKRSFQFFDAAGDAVHKIHLRPASNVEAWRALAGELALANQSSSLQTSASVLEVYENDAAVPHTELRERWEAMTDTHQFVGILRKLKISRLAALSTIGDDFAWRLDHDAVALLMEQVAEIAVPIMCFIGNQGCIQIHSGPIKTTKAMGPWLNVMDETFHMHLRNDRLAEIWAVRKPTDKGHVTSLEAYDADGNLVIQFFGKRIEGQDERVEWRAIVENLPRLATSKAA